MKSPLNHQIGGMHYKGMVIQPVELAYANRYDDCIFSAFKYLMRHEEKNGAADLAKGAHFCHLRWEMIQRHGAFPAATDTIPILRMAFANKMKATEQDIAVALHNWATESLDLPDDEAAAEIASMFMALSNERYPRKENT